MLVTEYILAALRDQGVDHCFIDLGGLNDNFMPPLTGTEGLRTIVAAFEGGAAYMADGYARALGGLGVCLGIGASGGNVSRSGRTPTDGRASRSD